MKMLSVLPLFIVALCVIDCCVSDPCPDGWKQFEYSCYHVNVLPRSWHEAQEECRRYEADLVKINSAKENEFVLQLVRHQASFLREIYIGLKKISNTFYWFDKSVPVYTNWAPGQPSGDGPCAVMYIGPKPDNSLPGKASGYWADGSCDSVRTSTIGLVCKKLA